MAVDVLVVSVTLVAVVKQAKFQYVTTSIGEETPERGLLNIKQVSSAI